MIKIDELEKKYNDWRDSGIQMERHIQLALQIEILKTRELGLIRMNLDRVNENLDWLCKIQDTQG